MAKRTSNRTKPHLDPNSRLQQLSGLALDEMERRVREGIATSQELTTLAKLGSEKTLLENERLRSENELLKAKKVALESAGRVEELYAEAIRAFKTYSGQDTGEDNENIF